MSRFGNLEFERQSAAESVTEQVADEVRHLRDAEAAMRRGLFEQALRAYGRVIEANPHHAGGWVGQVRMLIELGQFAEALFLRGITNWNGVVGGNVSDWLYRLSEGWAAVGGGTNQ